MSTGRDKRRKAAKAKKESAPWQKDRTIATAKVLKKFREYAKEAAINDPVFNRLK